MIFTKSWTLNHQFNLPMFGYKLYLTIAVIVLLVSCVPPKSSNDCDKLKKGKFKLYSKIDNTSWIIDRQDSIQYETNLKTGEVTIMQITWIAQCEYQLLRLNNTEKKGDSLISAIRKKPLLTKVTAIAKDYYVFESHKEGIPMRYSDTLWFYRSN